MWPLISNMEFLDKLLAYYQIDMDEYLLLNKDINDIHLLEANKISGMSKIKDRIFHAINNKEKIIIYGDYDCDGISATAILMKTFQKLNYDVSYFIPSRYIDGYGLNLENTKKIVDKGFKLIITVDNGISSFEAIEYAKAHDVDVIVSDHHELPDKKVEAFEILHPVYSNISNIVASGGYVALFLSAALLGYYDEYLLTIAALSVISDMMELKGYNRDVVRLGIYYFNKYKYKQLFYLIDQKNQNNPINELTFSLEIAPKINAVGRMKTDHSAMKVVKYLISDNKSERNLLLNFILSTNEERKVLINETSGEVIKNIAKDESGIILLTNLKEGLLGLIANKIMLSENKATAIFTSDENNLDIIKGSIRSKNGFSVVKMLEENSDILLSGGGHALAGGLSLYKKDFELFKSRFLDFASKNPFIDEEKENLEISLKDINYQNYQILRTFSPFGQGNKEPDFIIKQIPSRSLEFISNNKHISTMLSLNSKILGFNISKEDICKYHYIDLIGNFYYSVYKNKGCLEFRIKKFKEK